MINRITKKVIGKEIILFNRHRNLIPLLNKQNRRQYLFLSSWWLVKGSALFGRKTGLRYRVLAFMLNLIEPSAILDINWTEKHHTLYNVWCKKNERRFIVVQHGAYTAGVLSDIREKYVNCTTFLVWGEHFKNLVKRNNPGKQFECTVFGNPVYNQLNRNEYAYKKNPGNRILVATTVIKGKRLQKLIQFLRRLQAAGFEVTIKEHNLQLKYSEPIEGFQKTKTSLYKLLKNQDYDILLTDVSSAMLDAILYKTRVVYFSPADEDPALTENVYLQFLPNLAKKTDEIKSVNDLNKFVDISSQEELLQHMAAISGTDNRLDNLDEKIKAENKLSKNSDKKPLEKELI